MGDCLVRIVEPFPDDAAHVVRVIPPDDTQGPEQDREWMLQVLQTHVDPNIRLSLEIVLEGLSRWLAGHTGSYELECTSQNEYHFQLLELINDVMIFEAHVKVGILLHGERQYLCVFSRSYEPVNALAEARAAAVAYMAHTAAGFSETCEDPKDVAQVPFQFS